MAVNTRSPVVLLTFSTLLSLAAILCLSLKSAARNSYNSATSNGSRTTSVQLEVEFPDTEVLLANYPLHLGLDATSAVLAAAGLSLVSAIITMGFSSRALLKEKAIHVSSVPNPHTSHVLMILSFCGISVVRSYSSSPQTLPFL